METKLTNEVIEAAMKGRRKSSGKPNNKTTLF